MLSDISVRRPVLAAVAAIILCVVGAACFASLSVRELPSVDPPVVSVSTTYRGASAEVVEERITELIERQVAGIQGIERVNSSSRDGSSRISVSFSLDRDLDTAANDVRDAVSRVTSQLPDQADPPQIAKANADGAPIMFLAFSSTKLNRLQLSDYANRYLVERISTIPGVAQVNLGGSQLYSMRIWLDPQAMASRGITVDDVESALNAQNLELPAGALEAPAKDFTIRVARGYSTAQQFKELPVTSGARGASGSASVAGSAGALGTTAAADGAVSAADRGQNAYVTRLGDIARIEEAADERRRTFRSNGRDMVGIAITRQSQANDLEISKGVADQLPEINKSLPPGTKLEIAVDFTVFTKQAIQEVWITMAISLALVALVNFVFLGTWRAAIIPSVVAPICILSTFIVLAPLGFTINLLTLLALVLAIGLVVDDAIVVVENIQRRVDEGEPPVVAAQRGARQVFFAVVATTIVLISVFAPLMFLPGYIGKLFVELAVAITAAVAFSALLALSLSPMLASKLLRPAHGEGFIARRVDAGMTRLRNSYHASLDAMLGRRAASVSAVALVVVLSGLAFALFTVLPRELVPNEDRGRVDINIQGPEGAGYDYTLPAAKQVEARLEALLKDGTITRYTLGVPRFGQNQFNTGNANASLRDDAAHKISSQDLAAELNKEFAKITAIRAIASVRPSLQRGGGGPGGGGGNVDLIVVGNEYAEIERLVRPLMTAVQANPGMARPRLDYEPTSPRLLVDLDRDKAATLGVSARSVGRALETMFGSRKVTTYIKDGQEYDVILQTDRANRQNENDLANLYVRTGAGTTIPLSSVVTTHVRGDTPDRSRVDRLRAITLSVQLNPGYTVGEAVTFLQAEVAKNPGTTVKWGGTARDYLEAGGAVGLAFGMALLLVFLVLAAQFESWIHPAVIMLTVPVAVLGGLFGLLVAGSTINTYSQIGLIILVGIAAKNGILIVEFANQLRDDGLSIREAVIESASLRLRPIIMTSISAAAGALPLIFEGGAGGESRKTIGVVIFFGAIFTTLLTLFIVPVFYNLLARFTKSPLATARRIEAFEEAEQTRAANAAE
ncbi:MAG: efflux RND transporter permease subunit [Phenylobacterium sp.]|uniref:efflux RND transporter permease subunit n=1 Tax=Phenylobacterium sp. TaxID=1871053 RepID=UPI001B4C37FC|nr:efflux RND transporter permease subunit [Phenylobacterium sp.]MBP7649061.1 efflux RND transporter permease subunit [Phenylobacterium sp.]MBP7814581.1 efflux RND transporter permease subunit [Phenylobacterium sp.]MBP9231545.1 efflux RND transporter permease subunit [Phenylobacterium sp.]MBP9754818.1 efflux RND transporter permease subunit [Phenylobacterium sp.]